MRNYLITFRSVTYAQRGEAVLRSAGVFATLQRAPRHLEERGCGYSLSIHKTDISRALEILRTRQIPFRKVYLRHSSGEMEEVGR